MRFSIILPVYKVEKYLRPCVDSILSQTYQDFEIILVDDASPDSCPQICDEYATKDKRVKVIHKVNGGLSSARNAGLDIAQGDYIIFIDSDDWWDDLEALSKIATRLEETGVDILIFGMKKYFMQRNSFGDVRCPKVLSEEKGDSFMLHYMRNNIFVACACDKVVRRDFIEDKKLRFVEGQLSEDIEWCARLLLNNPRISVLSECFYVYRQGNSGSISSNITRKNVFHVYEIIAKYATSDAPVPLKHYLANQLVLLLSFSNLVSWDEVQDIILNCKKYWWLLKYDWYPYVRIVSKVKWLGLMNVRRLLKVYHYLKRS